MDRGTKKLILVVILGTLLIIGAGLAGIWLARPRAENDQATVAPVPIKIERKSFKVGDNARVAVARITISANQLTLFGGAVLRAENAAHIKRLMEAPMVAVYGLSDYVRKEEVKLDADNDLVLALPWMVALRPGTEIIFEIAIGIQCTPELEAINEKLEFSLALGVKNRDGAPLATAPLKVQKLITVTCNHQVEI